MRTSYRHSRKRSRKIALWRVVLLAAMVSIGACRDDGTSATGGLLLFVLGNSNCVETGVGTAAVSFASVTGLTTGVLGSFDPSMTKDPCTSRIWMSFSEADPSPMWSQNAAINNRLAFSDDRGVTWTDGGVVVNASTSEDLGGSAPGNAGTWVHETSRLVYDAHAPSTERWKIFSHYYLWINATKQFAHSWISMKTAAAPLGPWSADRKLFTGFIYDTSNDSRIGIPELKLNELHGDLSGCAVFTEPGVISTADGLYVALYCAAAAVSGGKIILIKRTHNTGTWEYKGTFLTNFADAPALGYNGFSGSELYEKNGTYYLMVSPTDVSDNYRGCLIFEVTNLETALLDRVAGTPRVKKSLVGTQTFHGACGYTAAATGSGILYFEKYSPPPFAVTASGMNP